MAFRDRGESDRHNRRKINTILIILSGVLIIAGVIFLLIEPYKAWKRSQITDNAMDVIQSEMSAGNTEITIVVPKDGNAAAGENGNSTILGHHYKNGTAFAKINKLVAGDQVIFTATDGTVYTFVVETSLVIPKEDLLNYIDASVSSEPQLTLVTCAYENGQSTLRQLVICKLAQ